MTYVPFDLRSKPTRQGAWITSDGENWIYTANPERYLEDNQLIEIEIFELPYQLANH